MMDAPRTTPEVAASGRRRPAILDAATTLFAEQGYHAVGMRAIADAVGIRSSSLYHHFPSKQALLAAIAMEYSQAFISTHLPILRDESIPAAHRLRRVLRDQIVYFWHHRLQREVGLRGIRDLREDNPEAHAQILDDLRSYQHAVTAAVEECMATVGHPPDDPALAARAIIGMVMSVNEWFREGESLSIEQVADRYASYAVDRILVADS